MITAIYSYKKPTKAMMNVIKRAVKGSDKVISNISLPIKHTVYKLSDKKKKASSGAVWGEVDKGEENILSTEDYPFNWLEPYAKPSAIISALAKDSDRIIILFPDKARILPIYIFLAYIFSDTVRVFRGTSHINFTPKDLLVEETKRQYDSLVLPEIKPIPLPNDLMETPNGTVIRPYQQQMVNFGLKNNNSGWFVDMGLGKTLAALVLIDEWIKREEIDPTKPIMIVAPIMVALDTWEREIDKWGYDWDIVINIRKTVKQRNDILRELLEPKDKPTLFLTNPDQLEQIRQYYFSRNIPLPFEVLIIDELSMFKSPNTKRSNSIQHYRLRAKKFLGLTGTPSPNNLLDVWNQIKIINYEDTTWARSNIYEFQETYFNPVKRDYSGFVRKWKPKLGADDIIYRNLSKDVISMKTEGLVEIPDITFTNKYVELPKKARAEYDSIMKEAEESEETGGWVKHVTEGGIEISLPSSELVQGKLTQIAGGALYDTQGTNKDGETDYQVLHDEKIEALDELITSSTSPMLVFYYYKSDLERIQKKYRNDLEVLDSKDKNVREVINRWNEGEIPVLLAHPASVGHGLNLQDGGHTIVWFSLPFWNNDYYQQANKRIHRSGQDHPVSVTHLIASDTIDGIMLRSIQAKEKVNSGLMEALDSTERR